MTPALFDPRRRSLIRANILVLGSLALATLLSGFPQMHSTLWLLVPALGVITGTVDTARCCQRRWCLYHGGVILCLYMDLMAVSLVFFFLLYPYFLPFAATH